MKNLLLVLFTYNLVLAAVSVAFADDHTDNRNALTDVIVVGSKTGTNRQDLATSVGYFGHERLEVEPIVNIDDVFTRSANVSLGTASNALASILVDQVAMGVN